MSLQTTQAIVLLVVCCLLTFLTIFLFSQYYLIIVRIQVKIFLSPSAIKMQIIWLHLKPSFKLLIGMTWLDTVTQILYKRYLCLCNPSSDRENQYKKYRNKLTCSLRAAKRISYAEKLEECKSNMRSTWVILNEVINNNKARVIYKRCLMLMKRKYPIQLRSRTISVHTSRI